MSEKEDRRKFLKKAVVFGAIAGTSLAAGDLLGARRALASSPNPTVGADPTFSADGVQVPSLGADPASPVAGQLWFRNDLGQLRVQSKASAFSVGMKPYVTVTPNGPTDGGDFGPKTPNTATAGIQEAINSLTNGGTVVIVGPFNPTGLTKLVIPATVDIVIEGTGANNSIVLSFSVLPGGYCIVGNGATQPPNANHEPKCRLKNLTIVSNENGIDEEDLFVEYDDVVVLGNSVSGSIGVNSRSVGGNTEMYSSYLSVGLFDTNIILQKDHVSFGRLTSIQPITSFIQFGTSSATMPIDIFIGSFHMVANNTNVTNGFYIYDASSAGSVFVGVAYLEMGTGTLSYLFYGAGSNYEPFIIIGIMFGGGWTNNTQTSNSNSYRVLSGGEGTKGYVAVPLPSGTGSTNRVTNFNLNTVVIRATGQSGTHIILQNNTDVALAADSPLEYLEPGQAIYYDTTIPTSWTWIYLSS